MRIPMKSAARVTLEVHTVVDGVVSTPMVVEDYGIVGYL
jgi:hypothetical protein